MRADQGTDLLRRLHASVLHVVLSDVRVAEEEAALGAREAHAFAALDLGADGHTVRNRDFKSPCGMELKVVPLGSARSTMADILEVGAAVPMRRAEWLAAIDAGRDRLSPAGTAQHPRRVGADHLG